MFNMVCKLLTRYYKSEKHLQWIMGNNDKGALVYNVRLALKDEEARDGAHTAYFYDKMNVKFVVLYTDGVEEKGKYRVLSDTVLWMLFRRTWVMAWSMLLATMQEPKHMAQRMSQMVSSIPAMPRVATKSLMGAKPVSTCVLV